MYKTVPSKELEGRIKRLQAQMKSEDAECAILRHGPDLYYFCGTVQDAHLFIPQDGPPTLFVWRSHERAKMECGIGDVVRIKNLKEIGMLIENIQRTSPKKVWTTFDTIPYNMVISYIETLFKGAKFENCTRAIRSIRAQKSEWELEQIEAACRMIDHALIEAVKIIRPGMDELELVGQIEGYLRKNGHQGLLPMRASMMKCLPMTQILTGEHGGIPAFTLTPAGGPGVSPAFGMGPGHRVIKPNEPISIDIGGSYRGYLGDETRLFSIGPLQVQLMDAYKVCLEVMERIEEILRPGNTAGSLYAQAIDIVKDTPFYENFMGFKEKVRFIGHGLGIEIDEYPFLSIGNEMVLLEGMVVAIEPKFIFPGLGVVGIEDTFVIEENRARRLTKSPRDIFIV